MPFVMAVAYGASASFLTPYGYTTNLMVQNLGGYEFRDYFRAGLPLSLVYSIAVIALIPMVFPFLVGLRFGHRAFFLLSILNTDALLTIITQREDA